MHPLSVDGLFYLRSGVHTDRTCAAMSGWHSATAGTDSSDDGRRHFTTHSAGRSHPAQSDCFLIRCDLHDCWMLLKVAVGTEKPIKKSFLFAQDLKSPWQSPPRATDFRLEIMVAATTSPSQHVNCIILMAVRCAGPLRGPNFCRAGILWGRVAKGPQTQ